MSVFVTGGTGFVGSHLVRHLLARGEEVVCLVRANSNLENLQALPVRLATGDIRNFDSVRAALGDCRVIYHCAADYRLWCKDPDCMYAVNVEGTKNVLQAASEAG